jgi:putative ATP-dependent endonuclease of OLD family
MPIKVKNICIQNFRSIKNMEVELEDCTLCIGQNNTGKSNFLQAMNIALGANIEVSESDIYVAKDERLEKSKRAVIDVLIIPIDSNNAMQGVFIQNLHYD